MGTEGSLRRSHPSSQHDRAPHPSDDAIEATWQLQLRDTPRLWDASKFRLAGGRVETRPASDPDRPAAILRLGLTSYKHHVGTSSTARPDADRRRLRRDGLERHGSKHAHLSAALGVETAVETADGRLVLLRRSASVASFSGAYNGPSGHPEPANVRDLTPRSIRRELFDAALREVTEETGIPAEALSRPRLIGAMIDADGKPDVLFRAETSATSRQVREWASRASDAWESSGMAFAPATPATANGDVGDGSRLVDLWGGADDVSVSAVTRAAADCLCMLAATSKDAAPEPKVWERALDAALEHEMFDVARRIERAQLARVGSG